MGRLLRAVPDFMLNPLMIICATFMAFALLIPFAWGDLVFGAGTMRINQLAASAREGISVDIDALDQEIQTFDRDYYLSRAEDSNKQAHLESDYRRRSYDEAMSALASYLADHPDQAFATSARMTLVTYLPLALSRMPGFFWFLPSVFVLVRSADLLRKRGLIKRAPKITCGGAPLVLRSGALSLILMLAFVLLPASVAVGTINGLGDPDYPVAFLREGELVAQTALPVLTQSLAFFFLGNLTLYMLGMLAFFAARSKTAALLPPMLLLGVASAPDVVSAWHIPDCLAAALPSTYYHFSDVIGYAGCFPTEMGPAAFPLHATIGTGLLICLSILITSIACILMIEGSRINRPIEGAGRW